MFQSWLLFLVPLGAFIVIGYMILLIGRRAPRGRDSKRRESTYMCGEPLAGVVYTSSGLYRTMRKALGFERLREIHTGRVSDYLLWVLVGLVIVMLVASLS
jgi:hypothetical protein